MKSKILALSKNEEFKKLLQQKKVSNKYVTIFFGYLDNKNKINELGQDFLSVNISIDGENNKLIIRDDAGGISEDRFVDALKLDVPKDSETSLHEFGVGMKIAALWLGDSFTIETSALNEDWKTIVKFDFRFAADACFRNNFAQIEWNVPSHESPIAVEPKILLTLFCISLAALLVKVTAKIWLGKAFLSFIILAILEVKTLVFPDPAPATIKSGPSRCITASFWASFKFFK